MTLAEAVAEFRKIVDRQPWFIGVWTEGNQIVVHYASDKTPWFLDNTRLWPKLNVYEFEGHTVRWVPSGPVEAL